MQDQTQPEKDALSAYFFQIADAVQEEIQDPSRTVFSIIRQVMDAAAQVLDSVALTCESPAPECAKGCSFCCHSRIHVTPLEAVLISAHIRDCFSPDEIYRLKTRIHANLAHTRGQSLAQRVAIKDKTPCIFLDDHACMVYDQRPFICRTWNSLDRGACEAAFVSGNHEAEIPCLSAPNYVYTLARDVVQAVCTRMHLEPGRLELVSAMDHCLALIDAADTFTRGVTIFGETAVPTGELLPSEECNVTVLLQTERFSR
ncbi:MAG: YkgJ family cysteine cluster protein [Desulfotignum sp.]|nr:YkgJ family cysteine cluster protein [Desulfotignum sp.]